MTDASFTQRFSCSAPTLFGTPPPPTYRHLCIFSDPHPARAEDSDNNDSRRPPPRRPVARAIGSDEEEEEEEEEEEGDELGGGKRKKRKKKEKKGRGGFDDEEDEEEEDVDRMVEKVHGEEEVDEHYERVRSLIYVYVCFFVRTVCVWRSAFKSYARRAGSVGASCFFFCGGRVVLEIMSGSRG